MFSFQNTTFPLFFFALILLAISCCASEYETDENMCRDFQGKIAATKQRRARDRKPRKTTAQHDEAMMHSQEFINEYMCTAKNGSETQTADRMVQMGTSQKQLIPFAVLEGVCAAIAGVCFAESRAAFFRRPGALARCLSICAGCGGICGAAENALLVEECADSLGVCTAL